MRVTPPINLTFSDDSLFLLKILGEGHKFSAALLMFKMHAYQKVSFQTDRSWQKLQIQTSLFS